MSEQPEVNLRALLGECGLLDRAIEIEDTLFQLQWGSAIVVVGVKGPALVIISPMFKELPASKEGAFCRRLLELNSELGGVGSFAIQPDGWVVLHGGRDTKGLDAEELALLLTAIAQQADRYDNLLLAEFYAPPAAGEPAAGEEPAVSGEGMSPG